MCLIATWGLSGLLPADADVPYDQPVRAGTLLFRTAPGVLEPAARLETDVQMSISGIIARVVVRQTFKNGGPNWMEGIYVFPLPDDAAVDHLEMHIGERIVVGEIREREEARKTYERAKNAGQRTSLVEQDRPNMFTTSVANIGPGEQIRVEIKYQQTVKYDSGSFSLRFPMTITPRYIPGKTVSDENQVAGTGWAWNTDRVPDASRITPPVIHPQSEHIVPARIAASLDAGFPLVNLESRYHDIHISRDGTRYTMDLIDDVVPMDRDFELSWTPVVGQEPSAAVFTEQFQGDTYALLMFVPPQASDIGHDNPRELVFVIDTSGSMSGQSIIQAKAAVEFGLRRLSSQDRFNVIQFNSSTSSLYPFAVPASLKTRADALAYVDGLTANGGTEMAPALRTVLADPPQDDYLRQVIFITDGSVGNEAELFQLIHDRLGDSRLFTVAIGSAPNDHFMHKAAQFGRGSYTFIGKPQEVRQRMEALFAKIERPALTDIEVAWPRGSIVEAWPQRIQDLYAGEPVVVTARLKHTNLEPMGFSLGLTGQSAGLDWQQQLGLGDSRPHSGISTLWARRKIAALMDSSIDGVPAQEIRLSVIDVALKHHLVSRFTSLVAVDKTPARARNDILKQQTIPNMLPAGADFEAIFGHFPTTATPALVQMLAGLMLICIAFFVRRCSGSMGAAWFGVR